MAPCLRRNQASSSSNEPGSLSWAHPVVREWFVGRFGTPTAPQELGWPQILAGKPTLISAPTGSGKTLAAFLICIDRTDFERHSRISRPGDQGSLRFAS